MAVVALEIAFTSGFMSSALNTSPQEASTLPPDYASSWYYLLSTVSQTFAAAYALMFAISIYRLQQLDVTLDALDRSIFEFFARIGAPSDYRISLHSSATLRDWDTYYDRLTFVIDTDRIQKRLGPIDAVDRSGGYIHALSSRFSDTLNAASSLRARLMETMLTTGVLIIVCTFFLPWGAFASPQSLLVTWLSTLVVSTIVLIGYRNLITQLLRAGPTHRRGSKSTEDDPDAFHTPPGAE